MSNPIQTTITLADVRARRDEIIALAEQYGMDNIRVFGSVARGDATPDSDVDFLVDQDWSKISGWGGMGFVVAIEDLLGCNVDVTTLEELKPQMRQRVLREAVHL